MEIFKIRESYSYTRDLPVNFKSADGFRFDPIRICEVSSANLTLAKDVKACQYYLFSGTSMLEDFCLPIQKRGAVNIWKQWAKLQLFPQKTVRESLWVTDVWSRNYFHWILECLPRILTARTSGITAPVLLPEHIFTASYVQDSLRDFGLEAITFNFRQTVKVRELYLASHDYPCAFDPAYLKLVVQTFQERDQVIPALAVKKVYISRTGAGKRKVQNERALLPILDKAGFVVVQMEALSFRQQRDLMRETKVLLSIHGAGLSNMIFMPEDSKVVELHPDVERYNSCFYHLSAALSRDYYYSFEFATHHNPQEADIVVDLKRFEKLVNAL